MAKSADTKASHKIAFGYKLLILFLSCLLILTGVLAFLWSFLGEYEKTNPKNCINEYIQLLKGSKYEEAMKLSEIEETEYFKAAEYKRYMEEILGSFEKIDVYETSTENPGERRFQLKGATDNSIGLILTEDDKDYKYDFKGFKLKQQPIERYSYTINLPGGYIPIVNGVELSEKNLAGEALPVKSYNSLNDKTRIPSTVSYKVDGLVFEPEITVKGLEDGSYIENKSDDRTLSLTLRPDEKNIKEYEQRAVDAAILYSKYIFKETDFDTLKKYFYEETDYFKSLKQYSNIWTVDHNPSKYENIKVKNTVEFSAEHYQTEVFIDQIIVKGKIKKVYPISYRLSFIKVGDSFKVANLEVI